MMDQLDTLQVRTGVAIGDIKNDKEALHDAVTTLEMEVADIKAQLAGEMSVPDDGPDWRRRAQGALRVKIKALATVRALLGAMRRQRAAEAAATLAPRPDREKRAQALLDTIRDELGDVEFDRLKGLAKDRHPALFGNDVQTSEASG